MHSSQIEGWRWFLGYYSPGGLRTPGDELQDMMMARLITLQINLNSTQAQESVRDFLLFPQPYTEEMESTRIAHARASLMGAIDCIRRPDGIAK